MSLLAHLLGDPFWLTTIAMSIVGWVVSFVGAILNIQNDGKHFPILTWWGIAFQFLVMALVIYSVCLNRLYHYRLAILSFLAIATLYSTNSTNNFVWRTSDSSTPGTIAAGQILLSIVNILWIFYVGTSHDEPIHMYVSSFSSAKEFSNTGIERRSMQHSRLPSNHSANAYGLREQATTAPNYPQFTEVERPSSFSQTSAPDRMEQTQPSSASVRSESLTLPTEYPYRARGLYTYSANPEDGNELSFYKDEVLEVSDITGRWWQARRATGEVGICPSNYVVLL